MMRLKKYLKPFIVPILAAIVLLFCSSMADLKLPDVMSSIVNVGIQQSGIEHASMDVISEDAYEFMQAFMTEEDRSVVDEAYELAEAGSDETLFETYPQAESRNVYVLKDTENREELDNIFGRASWTMVQGMQSQDGSQSEGISIDDIDYDQLFAMTPMLEMMDFSETQQNALAADETTISSTGVVLAKLFYEELGADTSAMQSRYILNQGMLMLLVAFCGVVATVGVGFFASKIGAGLGHNLRGAIFEKVESFSSKEFNQYSTSSLITRTTNDVQQVQMLVVMGLRMIISAPIIGIGALIMIFQRNTNMVWILGVAIIAVSMLIIFMFVVALPKFTKIQKLIDKLNLVSRENLSGLLVVRAFRAQEFEEKRFDQANTNLTNTNLSIQRIMAFMMPCMTLIMNFIMLLIIWVGSDQIAMSQMQVGDMMAFMQYAMQVVMAFVMIAMMFIMVPRATVSANRIADVLETEVSIQDPQKAQAFVPEKMGYVEFDDVCFNYGDAQENVLDHITFTAKPGETTAIIGSTGSGKSTVVQLIPRFYDVTGGSIKVNGVDVRQINQHELHRQVGYVAQKGVLLSGTIESNIKYGNEDLSEEEVRTVAKVAQADDFISQKEDGYQSSIAQGGTNVSGGQKQRLSIARALAVNAPIYVFDDSFSALDFKTDAALRAALKEHTSNATVIIVAQRVSSIMHAEQIIVLDEGKIVGKGTHDELLKTCPTYYEIASSQLSKEELENGK